MSEPGASTEEPPPPQAQASRLLHRLIEPPVLLTGISVLLLAVLWVSTFNLAESEKAATHEATLSTASDVADTYEAQAVRALREIDHALKVVRHTLETHDPEQGLTELRAIGLLPPELLFTVTVTDADGNVTATTHPESAANLSSRDYFQQSRKEDGLVIGRPRYDRDTREWRLYFSRRLEEAGGRFSGIVSVGVHAGYFVSGYDGTVLGNNGVLGLVGTDGVFRVRRNGNDLTAGDNVDYDGLVADGPDAPVEIEANDWDGIRRYTVARKLFEFPLAIVVGLSRAEQLTPAERVEDTYIWRASVASLLLVAVMAVLGRLSWQLQKARTRVMEERVAHAERVEYMAYHDTLTDLPNRPFFSRLLTQGIQQADRYERGLALLFLDLDRFKAINDSLGHEAGDDLLKEVGRRLQASVRESDIVARLGGDEFVILLPETTEAAQVRPVADKILAAVGKPYTLVGQEFRVTVSIGISMFPHDGQDEETLMKSADTAMYHAKEQGKNNYQFYSEELKTDSLERLTLESSLRNALERDEFRLFYQSKQDMATGRVTGVEALLRWQHPDLGLIQPMQFIPIAEETGLIVPIGRWVLLTACRCSVAWRQQGFPPLSMAVNLSARQFLEDELIGDVADALRETGMEPGLLELEVTESMIMRDMGRTIRILRELKQMGVRVAIDDFGTGYSSLSTLKRFPLDTIKIDGSFIQDLARSVEDRSLTEAVIAMGKSLSLTVIAEGVETSEQADFLRSHACDEFQGFYFNKPMPAEELEQIIRGQHAAREPSTAGQ